MTYDKFWFVLFIAKTFTQHHLHCVNRRKAIIDNFTSESD